MGGFDIFSSCLEAIGATLMADCDLRATKVKVEDGPSEKFYGKQIKIDY